MKRVIKACVTLGFVGYVPRAPGTAGTLIAAAVYYALPWHYSAEAMFLIASILGLLLARPAIRIMNSRDPQVFVLDEFAGFMTAMLFLPKTGVIILAGFVIFRILDTLKPLGIRKLDAMNHPQAVMWDDLLAGAYTNLTLRIGLAVCGIISDRV